MRPRARPFAIEGGGHGWLIPPSSLEEDCQAFRPRGLIGRLDYGEAHHPSGNGSIDFVVTRLSFRGSGLGNLTLSRSVSTERISDFQDTAKSWAALLFSLKSSSLSCVDQPIKFEIQARVPYSRSDDEGEWLRSKHTVSGEGERTLGTPQFLESAKGD
jgi:hypothetical protein